MNFDKRIEVVKLKNQGWSFTEIAKKVGGTRQSCWQMWHNTKDLTVEELEKLREEVEKNG